jgi:hypothetical protein
LGSALVWLSLAVVALCAAFEPRPEVFQFSVFVTWDREPRRQPPYISESVFSLPIENIPVLNRPVKVRKQFALSDAIETILLKGIEEDGGFLDPFRCGVDDRGKRHANREGFIGGFLRISDAECS